MHSHLAHPDLGWNPGSIHECIMEVDLFCLILRTNRDTSLSRGSLVLTRLMQANYSSCKLMNHHTGLQFHHRHFYVS